VIAERNTSSASAPDLAGVQSVVDDEPAVIVPEGNELDASVLPFEHGASRCSALFLRVGCVRRPLRNSKIPRRLQYYHFNQVQWLANLRDERELRYMQWRLAGLQINRGVMHTRFEWISVLLSGCQSDNKRPHVRMHVWK